MRHIEPRFVYAERLNRVRISVIDFIYALRKFGIYAVSGRNNAQIGTFFSCLPKRFSRFDAVFFRYLVFCKNYAVPFAFVPSDSHRNIFQARIKRHFDGRKKAVAVAMKNYPIVFGLHFFSTFLRRNPTRENTRNTARSAITMLAPVGRSKQASIKPARKQRTEIIAELITTPR